jgi:hypothetical protein
MKLPLKISSLTLLLLFGLISQACTSCQGAEDAQPTPDSEEMELTETNINIQVGSRTFTATLADNPAVAALLTLLPLTLDMADLNRNEKTGQLPQSLPTQTYSPGTIQNGDLLLWGANDFVIFYETFFSSYSYTRLGKIDDPSGLKEALGTGDVTVSLTLAADTN